jgi:F420-dependent oxidoreductase-like protein
MRIGLQVPNFSWNGGRAELGAKLAEIARNADQSGFSSLWVMDHFFQIPLVGDAEMDMLEGYSTLGFLAGITRNVKLGTLVTGITYRHPGVLAKTITTLDVLSGGRAVLGIGAAWFDREHHGLGVPFPGLGERFERLEETLQIVQQMWSDENGPYEGRHYQLAETLNAPQPVSRPHPPIMIGGIGEKKTLRLVARYGNACNLFDFIGPRELRRKLEVLQRHCDAEKRPYEEIEKTTLGTALLLPGKQTPSDFIAHCEKLAALGVEHAIFNLPNVDAIEPLETFGKEIIPAVAAF